MSLFSYLNTDSFGSSSVSVKVAQAMQTIAEKQSAAATSQNATTKDGSSVLITLQAKRAAAEKDDAKTPAADLVSGLRKSLDAAYAAAGQKDSANLTAMSGRALSTIALNETGQFSRAEIAAAKTELRERDRQSLIAEINSTGLTASSLSAYTQQLIGARPSMSAEEISLRDTNPNLR